MALTKVRLLKHDCPVHGLRTLFKSVLSHDPFGVRPIHSIYASPIVLTHNKFIDLQRDLHM